MRNEEELIELLDKAEVKANEDNVALLKKQQETIVNAFRLHGLQGKCVRAISGPQVNCFELVIENGENFSRKIQDELAIEIEKELEVQAVRMLNQVPGRHVCRLEVPNGNREFVTAGEMFRSVEWRDSLATLPVMMGKGVEGKPIVLDLAKAPHLLIGGGTGGENTAFMDSCIHSLMFRLAPAELKLILVDSPKKEFDKYKDLPYLQFPVINCIKDVLPALQWLNMEMLRRYKVLNDAGCRNIKELNERGLCPLPYIVIIINELADIMMSASKQIEKLLSRLCALSRAIGIHLVIGTQRPVQNVLTKSVKLNFPIRIAFRVPSLIDSRQILDADGAECLLGDGDMLVLGLTNLGALERIQGCYVYGQETARIMERLKSMYSDSKPQALPSMHGISPNMSDVLCANLANLVRDVLEDNLDWLKDELLEKACDEIVDSLIERWGELQSQGNTPEADCAPKRPSLNV